ncbi:C-type lectin-like [Trinorchestia longiramus]|nr:C-type lectin-like [Trinorchestia longiramus]
MATNVQKLCLKNTSVQWQLKCLLALSIIITCFSVTWSSTFNSKRSSKLILQPSDLEGPFATTTYNNISRVRCAAIALHSENSTFCSTSSNQCIAIKTSFPPEYNNSDGGPFHHCFGNTKPLFDIEAALKECNETGNCCPYPYRNITDLGCVFTPPFWWLPALPHAAARKLCQYFWPTGDLFIKPANWTALEEFLQSRHLNYVWVGATRNGNTSDFVWHDNSAVADEDFGEEIVLNPYIPFSEKNKQPDGRSKVVRPRFIIKPDCLLVLTDAVVNKLADDSCYEWRSYMCVIT